MNKVALCNADDKRLHLIELQHIHMELMPLKFANQKC